mmetsp:Transcript_61381/g.163234  ORF Transcript_61381/g.163234 Transcript_61381/m.163234 type:complete len:236 (-) Transcript_61381:22-729(-)
MGDELRHVADSNPASALARSASGGSGSSAGRADPRRNWNVMVSPGSADARRGRSSVAGQGGKWFARMRSSSAPARTTSWDRRTPSTRERSSSCSCEWFITASFRLASAAASSDTAWGLSLRAWREASCTRRTSFSRSSASGAAPFHAKGSSASCAASVAPSLLRGRSRADGDLPRACDGGRASRSARHGASSARSHSSSLARASSLLDGSSCDSSWLCDRSSSGSSSWPGVQSSG